jgi:hypothetical protein
VGKMWVFPSVGVRRRVDSARGGWKVRLGETRRGAHDRPWSTITTSGYAVCQPLKTFESSYSFTSICVRETRMIEKCQLTATRGAVRRVERPSRLDATMEG